MNQIYKYGNVDTRKKINLKTLKNPISVYMKITSKCMLNCKFCSQSENNSCVDMDFELAKKILKELKLIGVCNIYYTGGEPLLYNYLEELLEYGYELGFNQILITNGVLLEQKNIRKVLKYINSLGVSIHGNEKTHNKLSQKDCYKQIINGLRYVEEEFKNISININCTMVPENTEYNNIKFLATLCEKYNWKLTVARLNYIGNGKNYTKDNLKNMIEIVNQLNNEGFDIKISNCIAFCQLEDKYRYLCHGCGAGYKFCAIESNGDVKICASSNFVLGNMKDDRFKKIWKCRENKKFQKMSWLPLRCKDCNELLKCRGGCKAELSGEFWKESCDELLEKNEIQIWNEIKNKKLKLKIKNVRKEKYNRYILIVHPLRQCNKATLKILKIINGNYTGEDIAKMKPKLYDETKELLITLKGDKIIDI